MALEQKHIQKWFADYTRNAGTWVEIQTWGLMWRAVPMEWNQAKRLADISGQPVRIVGSDGKLMRSYDPKTKVDFSPKRG